MKMWNRLLVILRTAAVRGLAVIAIAVLGLALGSCGLLDLLGLNPPPDEVAAPSFTPPDGSYEEEVTVTIATTTGGALVYYTDDGSTPTIESTRYDGPFTLTESATVRAYAVKSGMTDSGVASAEYTITAPAAVLQVEAPTFDPDGGSFTEPVTVTIATATTEATIRYTTDGTAPDSTSALYDGPLTLSATTTLKAFATRTGMTDSDVATSTFTFGAYEWTTGFESGALDAPMTSYYVPPPLSTAQKHGGETSACLAGEGSGLLFTLPALTGRTQLELELWMDFTDLSVAMASFVIGVSDTRPEDGVTADARDVRLWSTVSSYYMGTLGSPQTTVAHSSPMDTWVKQRIVITEGQLEWWEDGVLRHTDTGFPMALDDIPYLWMHCGAVSGHTITVYVDDVLVRVTY